MGNFRIMFRALALSFKKRRLAVRLWAVNFVFALFAVAPFFFLMFEHMAHSDSGGRALQRLDLLWLGDFIYRYIRVSPAVSGSALLAVAMYLLLAVFLNGGIIGGLNRSEGRTTLAEFFHDSGLYFWPFLRLTLLSIPAYALFLAVGMPLIGGLTSVLSRRATTEWPALIASSLRFLLLVLLLTVVAMFLDYVRIGLVTSGGGKVLRQVRLTWTFVRRRFFRAWGLYLLAGLVFVAMTLVYLEIARLLPQNRPVLVLLAFLWQQAYILCRQWSRVLFYASGLEFFRQHREPEKATAGEIDGAARDAALEG
jgi:hypothetical protein